MAASGLVSRNDLVGTGRAISLLFGVSGVKNKRSHLVGPPFPSFKAGFFLFFSYSRLAFSRDLTRCLLIGRCGESTYLLRMVEITSGSSFEPSKRIERKRR